jgi:hypothetical protein
MNFSDNYGSIYLHFLKKRSIVCLDPGIDLLFYKLSFSIPVFPDILYTFSGLNLLIQVGLRIKLNGSSFFHSQIRATN